MGNIMFQDIVYKDEKTICFYTYSVLGLVNTILWEYSIEEKRLSNCCQMNGHWVIRKYEGTHPENGLYYVAITFFHTYNAIIGMDIRGNIVFQHKVSGRLSDLLSDTEGNIYVMLDQICILCLNDRGQEVWKWQISDFLSEKPEVFWYGNKLATCWITEEKIKAIAGGRLYTINKEGGLESDQKLEDYIAAEYKILNNKILVKINYSTILKCFNSKAELLWTYLVDDGQRITMIYRGEGNMICVVTLDEIHGYLLHFIDDTGKCKWTIPRGDGISFFMLHEMCAVKSKKDLVYLYDVNEQKKTIGHVIGEIFWMDIFEEKIFMIVKKRGFRFFVEECDRKFQKVKVLASIEEPEQEPENW